MNTTGILLRALFAGSGLLVAASPASAVTLSVVVSEPYQVMTGSQVRAGHMVTATTIYNRLTAGGTFVVRCNHPTMSLDVPGGRTISRETLAGGIRLNVSVPYEQPAYVNLP